MDVGKFLRFSVRESMPPLGIRTCKMATHICPPARPAREGEKLVSLTVPIRFAIAALALPCWTGCPAAPPPPQPAARVERLESLDALYKQLAERVVQQMGGEIEDFVITQSAGAWSVGTVLRQHRSVPVSY